MKRKLIFISILSCCLFPLRNSIAEPAIPKEGVLLAYDASPKESSATADIFAALQALEEAETSLKAANIQVDPLDDLIATANKGLNEKENLAPEAVQALEKIKPAENQRVESSKENKVIVITKLETSQGSTNSQPKKMESAVKSEENRENAKPVAKTESQKNQVKSAVAPNQGIVQKKEEISKPVAKSEAQKNQVKIAASTNQGSAQKMKEISPDPISAPHTLSMSYVSAVYQVNGVSFAEAADGNKSQASISQLYAYAAQKLLIYEAEQPAIGDLVFFHNTYDRNRDGRWNDWHSLIGIVEAVDKNATITVLAYFDNAIQRIHLNLKYPALHKNRKGEILNSRLRADEGQELGISSKLFAGFANLLGNKSSVTVIDNWKPGMKVK